MADGERVAVVTGGCGAIGGAVALALAQDCTTVYLADLEASRPENLPEGPFHFVATDVSSRASIEALFEAVERRSGRLDVLVNAAGIVAPGDAATLAEDLWDRIIDINLKGTFLCCQAAMRLMKRGGGGRIVNLGSVIGKNGGNARSWLDPDEQARSGNVAYGASKAGVHALTIFLARELAAHGITVNAVAPGPVHSVMTAALPAYLVDAIPLRRLATPEEVAHACAFLASDKASFVTAEILDVNGGMWGD